MSAGSVTWASRLAASARLRHKQACTAPWSGPCFLTHSHEADDRNGPEAVPYDTPEAAKIHYLHVRPIMLSTEFSDA